VIALIDYKAGNLTSVRKALGAAGAEVFVPRCPQELERAGAIVVPGVGHFGATRTLDREWVAAVRAHVDEGRPLLGICLGMQWLYESSEEAPELQGLGIFPGRCRRLEHADATVKVPHVGWNSLALRRDAWIVEGVADGAQVYFTHSYAGPAAGDPVAITQHGTPFAAIVQRDQVAGVQFHPEKSGAVGLRILKNFVQLER
jgi:imidazole glycerol-phosphate synthase subunit HisH